MDGKPTLLLDEVDKGLDFNNQFMLYTKILDILAEKYQIIAISHSIFSFQKHFNFIDIDGSGKLMRDHLKMLFS